jgi:hypothetical protein
MKHWLRDLRAFTKKLTGAVLGMALAGAPAFAAGSDGGKTSSTTTTTTTFVGLCLEIQSATVPPNGLYQLQVGVTEAKPVGKGSSAFLFSSTVFGTGVGASINDSSGQASGVLVRTANGFQVALLSPNATLATVTDYPIVTIAMPVRSDAQVGSQVPVSFDLANSIFLDGSGQPDPLQLYSGTLSIGGTLNITGVTQGGTLVPTGATISILGSGFTSSARVDIEGANVVTTRFVSPQELDVTLDRALMLDGVRVRVETSTERVMYYPYLRTTETGSSSNPLITASDPLFSRVTYTSASLPWTRGGTAFTGLALQNPGTGPAQVTLSLLSSGNQVLQTFSFSLPGKSRMTEDLFDFFAQPGTGVSVQISSSQAIELLGMQGDSSAGTITPVVVSTP